MSQKMWILDERLKVEEEKPGTGHYSLVCEIM